jgi:hypothetical protein
LQGQQADLRTAVARHGGGVSNRIARHINFLSGLPAYILYRAGPWSWIIYIGGCIRPTTF